MSPPNSHARTDPDRWINEHGDALYRFAWLRVERAEVVEDLVQETFVAALRSRERFAGNASERTWLISILKRKIVDHLRASTRQKLATQESGDDDWLDSLFDERERWKTPPGDWGARPEGQLECSEFWQIFHACLNKLPPRLAQAFRLRIVEEEISDDVCKVLHISPTNLWVMLHRARLRLAHCLQNNWFGESR